MSDELEDMMAKPGAMLDNALASFTKKGAATLWGRFKRQLSTGTEPLFRKDMGERYFSAESLFGGAAIWVVATIVALMFPTVRSLAPVLLDMVGFYRLERLFQHWLPTFLVGGALVFCHVRFGLESVKVMARYRADGTAYHTQSRGIPRWGSDNIIVAIGIALALFLFDLPAGILFVVSCGMSAKLAGEQQAAIYARYLDALDQKIEQEYLEDAILGKCPTEITQLTKPLPMNLNPDLRSNIAAAAVGKPVKIIAKAPRATSVAPQPTLVAQS